VVDPLPVTVANVSVSVYELIGVNPRAVVTFPLVNVKVPPNVQLPLVVTVPDKLKPLTVPVPLTDVTVPVFVVYPAPLVI